MNILSQIYVLFIHDVQVKRKSNYKITNAKIKLANIYESKSKIKIFLFIILLMLHNEQIYFYIMLKEKITKIFLYVITLNLQKFIKSSEKLNNKNYQLA